MDITINAVFYFFFENLKLIEPIFPDRTTNILNISNYNIPQKGSNISSQGFPCIKFVKCLFALDNYLDLIDLRLN